MPRVPGSLAASGPAICWRPFHALHLSTPPLQLANANATPTPSLPTWSKIIMGKTPVLAPRASFGDVVFQSCFLCTFSLPVAVGCGRWAAVGSNCFFFSCFVAVCFVVSFFLVVSQIQGVRKNRLGKKAKQKRFVGGKKMKPPRTSEKNEKSTSPPWPSI